MASSVSAAVAVLSNPGLDRKKILFVLGVIWTAAYAPVLLGLARSWFVDTDMQHGAAVPFVAGYLIWLMRPALAGTPIEGTRWGVVLVVWGVLQSSVSMVAEWLFLIRTGMFFTGIGLVVSLYGVRILKPLAFPLALSLFMIPPPTFVYSALTFRLQLLASNLAETMLEALNYSVLREGNILETGGNRWSVAEACSGIRSLITLTFFFLVYAYLFVSKFPVRILLLTALVPIAVAANAVRVVLTVAIGQYDRELALGMMHDASGYVIVVVAAAACIALHRFVEKMYPLISKPHAPKPA